MKRAFKWFVLTPATVLMMVIIVFGSLALLLAGAASLGFAWFMGPMG